jgi:hypothetical protein
MSGKYRRTSVRNACATRGRIQKMRSGLDLRAGPIGLLFSSNSWTMPRVDTLTHVE